MSEVADLLTATEPVGHDGRERAGGFDCGEQVEVGDGFGELEFVFLEAEWAGHAAAGGVDEFDLSAGLAKERKFGGGSAKDGLVVAVAVKEKLSAIEAAGHPVGRVSREPVG